ncbi:MAG TPA: hypothetical protein VE575_06595 [Acidimicrobiales bacterium]|nr:hypothetical protein [Acidimicrobiales bacterium]
MKRKKTILAGLIAGVALLASATIGGAASPWEQQDVFGQGMGGPTVAPGGAKILRTATGVSASLSMPTPVPDSYTYPQGDTASGVPGHPEAFSLWVFVFFNPEECVGDCDGTDLQTNPDVVAGAFNGAGHVVGGPNLTLTGHVNHGTPTFGGPMAETLGQALGQGFDLADAEIHLAVAPHGALDPELLPAEIKTPVGNPDFWWMALFK